MWKNNRPEGWNNPYHKEGMALPENIPWLVFYDCYEAGADNILSAIWKMAKESPTGIFFFDSNITQAYAKIYDLPKDSQ